MKGYFKLALLIGLAAIAALPIAGEHDSVVAKPSLDASQTH